MIGRTVGHYRILERLGGGGMGVVYKAEDTKLGRMVALKFLPNELTRDDEAKQRFLLEAKAAAKIAHPNICTVHEIAESDEGQTFIAMQYVEGESLAKRIARGPLPIEEAAKIAVEVARGLGAAHKAGIIHRDIKPANIMLTTEGEVKIVDFGVAKLSGISITRSMSSPGTLEYMAPEQLQGEPVTPATDLWALGVVLYEMLTATRPFRGGYDQAVAYAILNQEPATLDETLPTRPAALDTVLAKMLAKNPNARYQATGELIAALEPVAGLTPSFHQPSPARRAATRTIAFGAVLALTMAALGAWLFWPGSSVDAPTDVTSVALPSVLEPNRVVVAVFENRTGDQSLDPVGRSAAEWSTDVLTRLDVDVIPSKFAAEVTASIVSDDADKRDPAIALAEETRAGLLVTGEYYLNDITLSLRAKLIATGTQKVLFVLDPAEGPRSNPNVAIEALGERVRAAVATQLFGSDQLKTIAGAYTTKPMRYEAYVELLRAEEARERGAHTEAHDHVRRAADLDPDSVQALLWLSDVHVVNGEYEQAFAILDRARGMRDQLSRAGRFDFDACSAIAAHRFEEAVIAQRQLVAVAPGDAGAKSALGFYLIMANRPREAVEVLSDPECRRFAAGRPTAPFAAWSYYRMLNGALAVLGEHDRELTEARTAVADFPDVGTMYALEGSALAALGRFDELHAVIDESLNRKLRLADAGFVMGRTAMALRAYGHREQALELARRDVEWQRTWLADRPEARKKGLLNNVCLALVLAEQWDEADDCVAKLIVNVKRTPEKIVVLGDQGAIAAAKGDVRRAREIASRIEKMREKWLFGIDLYARAMIAAQLGEKDEAVSLLRRAVTDGFMDWWNQRTYPATFSREIWLEPLRGYGPYEELLKPKG